MKTASSLTLCAGGAVVPVAFENPPLPPFRALRRLRHEGRLYHQMLMADILDPFLRRWSTSASDERSLLRPSTDVAMSRCLAAFHTVRRGSPQPGEEAIFAALTVTANLQRTLTALAERLAQPAADEETEPVLLSRSWCGFAPARCQPVGNARWRALGCSPMEIEPRCQDALQALRSDIRRGRVVAREDFTGAKRSIARNLAVRASAT